MAHRFAAAFLVPRKMAYQELGCHRKILSMYGLHTLKHKYGMSMQAWIYRAKDLKIITESYAKSMFQKFRKCGWFFNEPGDPLPDEKPERMKRLIMRALAEDIISEARASELLAVPLKNFKQEVIEQHGSLCVSFS